MLKTVTDEDHLSEAEVIDALGNLNEADLAKLKMIAKKLSGGVVIADDLFQDAVLAALGGYENQKIIGFRKCPRNIHLPKFLASAMKSIASNARNKKNSYGNQAVHAETDENIDDFLTQASSAKTSSKEQELILNETLGQAFGLFEDDDEAALLLIGVADGLSVNEVCSEMQIDRTRYNSTRTRIRRKIKKHYPKGLIL